jgi:ribonuclease HII
MQSSLVAGRFEAGIDEAGRGPLFGSVFAAAVIAPEDGFPGGTKAVRDSKKYSSRKTRATAAELVKEHAIDWAVGEATAAEVDKANIRGATLLAMRRAIQSLRVVPDHLVVDGSDFEPFIMLGPDRGDGDDAFISIPHTCVVKGDSIYASVAAASVLAKVAHDAHIAAFCESHPEAAERYGLSANMGYGTAVHIAALRAHGPLPMHRKSFAPCRQA